MAARSQQQLRTVLFDETGPFDETHLLLYEVVDHSRTGKTQFALEIHQSGKYSSFYCHIHLENIHLENIHLENVHSENIHGDAKIPRSTCECGHASCSAHECALMIFYTKAFRSETCLNTAGARLHVICWAWGRGSRLIFGRWYAVSTLVTRHGF